MKLTLPAPERLYCKDSTYGQLYSAVAELSGLEPGTALILATDNRAKVAVTLLASAVHGYRVLLPRMISLEAIQAIQLDAPDALVVVDESGQWPANWQSISVDVATGAVGSKPPELHLDSATLLSLFTGGSTGEAQRWEKSSLNLFGEAADQARMHRMGRQDVILSTVPPRHIYGLLFTVLMPLVAGARVIDDTVFYPAELLQRIEEHQPTILVSVPPHFQSFDLTGLGSHRLRLAFSSGGFLPFDADRRFFEQTGLAPTEVYGSTETGGIATRRRMADEWDYRPLPGISIKIRDGKLAVNSPYLSESLPRGDDGFFLTADRVQPTEYGFELLGRDDDIVKVGAKRVDLGEIEQAMEQLSGVKEAKVVSINAESVRGVEIIAAYIGSMDSRTVQQELRERLQPEEIPRRLVRLEAIPRTSTGKIDRQELLRRLNVHDE